MDSKKNKYAALQNEIETMIIRGQAGEDSHFFLAFMLFLQHRWRAAEKHLLKAIDSGETASDRQKMGALILLHYIKGTQSRTVNNVIFIG